MPKTRTNASRRRFIKTAAAGAASTFFIGRSAAADDVITMKLATVAPADTPWANQMKDLKGKLFEASGKRLKLKPYLGGGLGDEVATAEACKRGTVHVWGGSVAALTNLVPELEVLELPYLFPTPKKADKIIDEIVGPELDALLLKAGFVRWFWSENGLRSIGSTFPIKSIADLKGRSMRSQESQVHLDMWKAFGTKPTPIPVTEVVQSLQTGVVDGYDNTPLFSFAASWHQAISHFTVTEHIYQAGVVVISQKFWDTLPADLQTIMMTDPQGLSKQGRRGVRAIAGALLDNFRNENITVTELDDTMKAGFKGAAAVTHAQFLGRTSEAGKALYQKITAAL
ncbi:MAG: TRAP transporter substrate-binding protein [Nannocystaceae bacterium]|nr:TRAP transporter substrate-binding protein [Deltaproteobacteria bacterium]MBP7291007.1 TRAP transporter substrate-binding protein [Nannocystaceae bacterium]